MLNFFALCLPIFAVVGLGWIAVRAGLITAPAIAAIGGFSYWFALPALLLRLMAAQPLRETFEPTYFQGYLGACLTVFAVAFALALALGQHRPQAAALGAAAAMGNVGYLGPPLLLPLLGPRVAGPVAMAIMAEVAVVLAIGAVLMARRDNDPVKQIFRGIFLNTVIMSIFLGALIAALEWPIPPPIDRFLVFLGGAAGPTALFALGGTLGALRLGREMLAVAVGVTTAKLLAYPLLVWLVLGWLRVDPVLAAMGVLLAAMPTATNAFVMAQRNQAATEEVSAAVLLSTLLAAVAFPLTAWLLA